VTCQTCDDERFVLCGSCAGSGEGGYDGSRCWTCRGDGSLPCGNCEGTGEVECECNEGDEIDEEMK
jgi:hypothetical protein